MEKIFNKLVRDKIPDIINKNGDIAITKILSDSQYKSELFKKLLEECNEAINSQDNNELKLELADIYEVFISILKVNNITLEQLQETALEKRNKRGSFTKKIFLEKTIDNK